MRTNYSNETTQIVNGFESELEILSRCVNAGSEKAKEYVDYYEYCKSNGLPANNKRSLDLFRNLKKEQNG